MRGFAAISDLQLLPLDDDRQQVMREEAQLAKSPHHSLRIVVHIVWLLVSAKFVLMLLHRFLFLLLLLCYCYCYCEWSIFHEISAPVYLCIVTLCNWYICCRHWFFCVHFYFYWSSMNLQLQCTMGFHITFKEMEQFVFKLILWLQFSSKVIETFFTW